MKWMILWRAPAPDGIRVFARAGIDAVARRIEALPLDEIVVHATVEEPPRFALVPFRRDPIALVSIRGSEDALARARDALSSLPGTLEGWRVDESIAVARTDACAVTLLTLFRKARTIDRDTFFARWFGEHTPMTLEIHPVVGYVRNAIEAPVIDRSPDFDAIVTEDFAQERDLTTLRLFGRGPRAISNAIRVARHVPTFLDLRTIETWMVEERVIERR